MVVSEEVDGTDDVVVAEGAIFCIRSLVVSRSGGVVYELSSYCGIVGLFYHVVLVKTGR